jgi:hypothetical protein
MTFGVGAWEAAGQSPEVGASIPRQGKQTTGQLTAAWQGCSASEDAKMSCPCGASRRGA